MKCFLTFFLTFFILFGNTVYAKDNNEPKNLYAQSAVLIDADSGRVLFEKNGQHVMAMASTTKIMTCILAIEKGNMKDVVTISDNAVHQPKVHLGMKTKEEYYLVDLLYSLMLESHNDSAVAIAEHISGSVEAFAETMNKKAKELGCNKTHFITPNGLDAVDEGGIHATTATELAIIMRYCIKESEKKDDFLTITRTPSYQFKNVKGDRNFSCTNRNSFLSMMEGALSGKTGFTGKAGYCYVGALERDGKCFIVALLACGWPNNKNYKWSDTKVLMEYGIEQYEYQNVYESIKLPKIRVNNGVPNNESLFGICKVNTQINNQGVNRLDVLLRQDEKVDMKVTCLKEIEAPVRKGSQVGIVTYYLNGNILCEYEIVVSETIPKKTLSWYFEKLTYMYFAMQN